MSRPDATRCVRFFRWNSSLRAQVSLLQAEVADLKTERTRANEDKRLLNVIIRGIPEDRNEKVYVIMSEFRCAAG